MPFCFNIFMFSCFNDKGFTLIEVIVSIAIIGIAFFAVIGVFPYSLNVNQRAQNLTSAVYLTQAGVEKSLSLGYETLGTGMVEAKARLSNDPANFLYPFYRQISVSYVDANLADSVSDTSLKKIAVTVFWQNPLSAQEQQYTLTTLLSKN
jgi:prepilin-type N-terminal cleavage/methylation domain-containing protein